MKLSHYERTRHISFFCQLNEYGMNWFRYFTKQQVNANLLMGNLGTDEDVR